jgi:Flp pilus assembly protein CpaB
VNVRSTLGLLLFATSVLLGQRVLSQAGDQALVWSATRDIPQGSVLAHGDIQLVGVGLAGAPLESYASSTLELAGSVVTRPVVEGELIATAWISDEPSSGAERSMTIPVGPDHAVGGDLRPGDRVDVYATFDAGDARARTSLLARDIEIIDVVYAAALTLGDEAFVGLTVGVSPDDAARLAFAIRTAEIDVVKVISSGTTSVQTDVSNRDIP